MAFLDNSGDIILDAVLTDAGRQRLARGQFKIVKFALGDEEINYSLFNGAHPSGSAFYDLEVMQTPILEAFTNNTSLMKSKLVTIIKNNILYMPTFKLNNGGSADIQKTATAEGTLGFEGYVLTADLNTTTNNNASSRGNAEKGVLYGDPGTSYRDQATVGISVDTGIDSDSSSSGLSVADAMPADLLETAFLVRVDDRLIKLYTYTGRWSTATYAEVGSQFVDDDRIATYFFALGDNNPNTVSAADQSGFRDRDLISSNMTTEDITEVKRRERFDGPLGTVITLYPKAAPSVRNSSSLFDKMGTAGTSYEIFDGQNPAANIGAHKFIDTTINVVGITTGQSIDIPIRIVKKT